MNDDLNLTYTPRPGHNDVSFSRKWGVWLGFKDGVLIEETASDGPSADDAAATRAKLDAYVARKTKKAA